MENNKTVKTETVKLTTGVDKAQKSRTFDIKVANKLLSMPRAKWKLDDSKYSFNGTEITKSQK